MNYFLRHGYGIILSLICLLLVVLSAYAGIALSPVREEAAQEAAQEGQRLAEDCEAVYINTFAACRHTVTYRGKADAGFCGLTFTELSERYPRFRVTEFSPSSVTVRRTLQGYCPGHVILYQREEGLSLLRRSEDGETMLTVAQYDTRLCDDARELLYEGKVFSTEGEARAFVFMNRAR